MTEKDGKKQPIKIQKVILAVKISEVLGVGAGNAMSCNQIADVLGVEPRTVRLSVMEERRNGARICSNIHGFYIAVDDNEVVECCERLRHRAGEIFKTRRALLNTIKDKDGEQYGKR